MIDQRTKMGDLEHEMDMLAGAWATRLDAPTSTNNLAAELTRKLTQEAGLAFCVAIAIAGEIARRSLARYLQKVKASGEA